MKQSDIQELCTAINKGMYIQSFHWESVYSVENDSMQDDLTIIFSPQINYLGEKLLKVIFYGTDGLYCGNMFQGIFKPVIAIKDLSAQGFEHSRYFVDEVEDEFYFYCDDIEYWWEDAES